MNIIVKLFLQLVVILAALVGLVYYLYIPVTEGVVHLRRAQSEATLMR